LAVAIVISAVAGFTLAADDCISGTRPGVEHGGGKRGDSTVDALRFADQRGGGQMVVPAGQDSPAATLEGWICQALGRGFTGEVDLAHILLGEFVVPTRAGFTAGADRVVGVSKPNLATQVFAAASVTLRGGDIGQRCAAGAGTVFIDDLVAIIIDPVALVRPARIAVEPLGAAAGETRRATALDAAGRVFYPACWMLVDLAVAVVVEPIAAEVVVGAFGARITGPTAVDARLITVDSAILTSGRDADAVETLQCTGAR